MVVGFFAFGTGWRKMKTKEGDIIYVNAHENLTSRKRPVATPSPAAGRLDDGKISPPRTRTTSRQAASAHHHTATPGCGLVALVRAGCVSRVVVPCVCCDLSAALGTPDALAMLVFLLVAFLRCRFTIATHVGCPLDYDKIHYVGPHNVDRSIP